MGEVYTANDSNLGRQVALKILPGHRTSDPDRVARFVREARASSALNHPAIVAVHDAGSEGNLHFLAMELIDGESLAEWMKKSRKLSRSIEVMAQVAEGLARAHAHGIVHRDLKPDNIMISRDGYAKIVDFGVAKLTERLGPRAAHTGNSTPTSRIGTTAYMSPEQVEGSFVDHRSDVFAFGTVLYELLAGRNPFASPQYADTLHNIVHLDPPLECMPANLKRIVRRCFRKDPEERYQSMKDAALDLREALVDLEPPRLTRIRQPWLVIALLAATSLAALSWYWNAKVDVHSPQVAAAGPSMKMTRLTNSGRVRSATISPDGRYLVYSEDVGDLQGVFVKQIATGTTNAIVEPQAAYHFHIRVSSDGNYVYYASSLRSEQNIAHVFQIPLLGGMPRRIASDTEPWYSLSPDGSRIVFTRLNGADRTFRMTVASTDGAGEEVILERRGPQNIGAAVWAPDGRSITFGEANEYRKGERALRRIDLATRQITNVPVPKWPGVGSYAWLPDSSGLLATAYERDQPPQVWFVPAGSRTGRKVTSEISAYYSVQPTADSRSFVAVRDTTDSNVVTVSVDEPLRPVHRVTSGFGNFWGAGGVRWLTDQRVMYSGIANAMNTFFAADVDGGPHQRLIRNVAAWDAVVSPDRTRIAFVSDKSGQNQIWIADADGENARQLTSGKRAGTPAFSPDGRYVVYLVYGDSQLAFRTAADGSGTPEQLTSVPTSRIHISPDGRWMLVRIRSTVADGGPLWRTVLLPADGKGRARYFGVPRFGYGPYFEWHPSSREFFFLDTKDGIGNLWLQPIDGGEPRQVTFFTSGAIFSYDLSPDGKSLVLSRGEPTSDAVLIQNWR